MLLPYFASYHCISLKKMNIKQQPFRFLTHLDFAPQVLNKPYEWQISSEIRSVGTPKQWDHSTTDGANSEKKNSDLKV